MNMKSSPLRVAGAFCAGLLLLLTASPAAISFSNVHADDFTAAPLAGDWITSASNIAGTDATFTSTAAIDTAIITNNYNATGLTTAVGSAGGNPAAAANPLAVHNTTLGAVQMRPPATPAKAASILVAKLRNDSGNSIPALNVAYDFANPGAGTEQVPGWQAYFSTTGNSGWTKIDAFSTAAPGRLSATLNFSGSGWGLGTTLYLLWVDDNASGTDAQEAAFTMDNFSVTIPGTPVMHATVSNLIRGLGANGADPMDDTVSFDLTVTGTDLPAGSPGWTTTSSIPAVPAARPYGETATISNVVISSFPLFINLADQSDPNITGTVAVTAADFPHFIALNTIGAPALIGLDPSSAPQWAPNGQAMSLTQTNGGGSVPHVASTAPITFAPGSPKFVTLTMQAEETSNGSNFETNDRLKIELVTDAGTQVLTATADRNGSGFINGFTGATPAAYDANVTADEFNRSERGAAEAFISTSRFHGVIPATATTAKIVVTGVNDSTAETYRISDILFGNAQDTDGDGVFDSLEIESGTDPNDRESFFRVTSAEFNGDDLTVMAGPAVTSRRYQFETSPDNLIWTPRSPLVRPPLNGFAKFTVPRQGARMFGRVTVQQ
jgi:hypothetical protein